ncbi:MAG: sugar phosphate isomerase/epimerase family protein [Planctomycetota bacterium]
MRRLSASELSSVKWSFFQDTVRYSLIGFESIGLWRHKLEEHDREEVADMLHEMKLSVSSVGWAGGFTGSDGMTFAEAIEDTVEAIQLAGTVGAQCVILNTGSRNGHTRNHARRLLSSALDELLPVAADYDVRLSIEPVPPCAASASTVFDNVREAVNFVTCYTPDQLGLVLDLCHVGTDKRVFDNLSRLIPWVSLVQVADCRTVDGARFRCTPGTGDVPIEDWLFSLQQHGFRGPLEIEVHSTPDGRHDYFDRLSRNHELLTRKLSRIGRQKAPTGRLANE